jgi:two-component system cell cycle sensor histidine kinase/response regulator CckA
MMESREVGTGTEEKQRLQIACHQIVTTIASAFANIHTDRIDDGIEGALKSIGEFIGASRGLLLLLDIERKEFECTHEWCSEGAEPLKGRLRNLGVEDLQWWMESFRRLESISITRLDDIPPEGQKERQHLESLGICSAIVIPFDWHGDVIGFMTFGSHDREITIPGECIGLFGVVGGVYAGAMDRKRVEAALRESEEFMTALMANIPGLVYRITTHRDGRISMDYLSPDAHRIAGLRDSGLEGSPQELISYVHEDDRGLVERTIASAWDDPRPVDIEIRLVSPSGRMQWVRAIARPQVGPDAITWYGVLIDVTDRKETEEALRQSEGQHRLLAENISDVIWTMDFGKNGIGYVSPSARNLTGFTPGELTRMPLSQILAPGSLEKAKNLFESHIEAVRAGTFETITVELELLCRDGATACTESTVSVAYDGAGTPQYILGVTRDISERKRLEDQLRQSAKMQAIGELAGGIAHEFNNMLTGILGYANMLRLTAEPGTAVHESARTIERAAERAADLTRKLLGFARRGRQRRELLNLHELIRDVITLLMQTLSESIRISCEMNGDEIVLTGDPGQIEQVILNLALNARDAMPSGGDLTISAGTVELADTSHMPEPDIEPGRYAVLTVTDTGSGIAAGDRDRIFEPFFTTKGQGRGTGMGLAMVYGTVKNHGGFIEVDSRPGEGATFRVYLPQDRCDADQEHSPVADRLERPGSGRILVVDDEDLVRDVARSMLEVCGYEVVAVSNGLEAVDYYRDHGDGIDLVLIDMVMPEMSGRECFRALRGMNPNVRAVLSTGYGADGEAREVVQEGMAGLVLKPFSKAALSATIREALTEEPLPAR